MLPPITGQGCASGLAGTAKPARRPPPAAQPARAGRPPPSRTGGNRLGPNTPACATDCAIRRVSTPATAIPISAPMAPRAQPSLPPAAEGRPWVTPLETGQQKAGKRQPLFRNRP
jgi:hypothetical protein